MEKKNVPKIRFPGFTEPWEQRKLGELSKSFEYGLNVAAKEFDGKNKYIRITDIDDESHNFRNNSARNDRETRYDKLMNEVMKAGVKTKVISTADIYASYQDLDYFCRIKRAIKYYRDNYGVKYVLLGGDISMVPALSAYCYYEKGEQTYTFFGPADIFYSCLGKIEWDSNNNMLYGELEDGINLVPLISVTRIPVNNNIEARIVIDKIINYEKNETRSPILLIYLSLMNLLINTIFVFISDYFNIIAFQKQKKSNYYLLNNFSKALAFNIVLDINLP